MKKNKLTKRIAYAFPTSTASKKFGFEEEGCYFIEYTLQNIEGSDQSKTFADEQVGGFEKRDQDLLDSFEEANGKICKQSLKYHPHYYTV